MRCFATIFISRILFPTLENLVRIVQTMALRSPAPVLRVVMSVCCSLSSIELKSSQFCVCLDRNKKSLHAGAVASQYLHIGKSKTVFFWHNMNHALMELTSSIHYSTQLPIVVLFQHPSPSRTKRAEVSIGHSQQRLCVVRCQRPCCKHPLRLRCS